MSISKHHVPTPIGTLIYSPFEILRLINWLEIHGYHETAKSVFEAFTQEMRRDVRNSSSQVEAVIYPVRKVGR